MALLGCAEMAKPVPAWSPPVWLRGTWTATDATGTVRVVASQHNVVLRMSAGGVQLVIDIAEGVESGHYSVQHLAGVRRSTGTRYFILRLGAAAEDLAFEEAGTSHIWIWIGADGPWALARSDE